MRHLVLQRSTTVSFDSGPTASMMTVMLCDMLRWWSDCFDDHDAVPRGATRRPDCFDDRGYTSRDMLLQ